MSLASLLTEPVTIRRFTAGAPDAYGNPTDGAPTDTGVLGRLEQVSGSELTVDRDAQVGEYRLFLPADTQLDGHAQVLAGEATFEVVGPPIEHKTPRGGHHLEVRLRQVTG